MPLEPKISSPHLSLPQLLQEQFLERSARTGGKEIDAARLAILAHPLNVILDGVLIMSQTIFAEGYFLRSARFGIDQAQVAEGRGRELFWREDLHQIDLEPSA